MNRAMIHVPKSPTRQKADRYPSIFADQTFERNETVPFIQLEGGEFRAGVDDKRDFRTSGRALDFEIYSNLVALFESTIEHKARSAFASPHAPVFHIEPTRVASSPEGDDRLMLRRHAKQGVITAFNDTILRQQTVQQPGPFRQGCARSYSSREKLIAELLPRLRVEVSLDIRGPLGETLGIKDRVPDDCITLRLVPGFEVPDEASADLRHRCGIGCDARLFVSENSRRSAGQTPLQS